MDAYRTPKSYYCPHDTKRLLVDFRDCIYYMCDLSESAQIRGQAHFRNWTTCTSESGLVIISPVHLDFVL